VAGFGIQETAEGFTLRRGDEEIKLTVEEFYSLRADLNLWPERMIAEFQARGGEVNKIVSHQIAEAGVWHDAIQANVLLTLTTAGGRAVTFSIPIPVASDLVGALHHVLMQMQPLSKA